jgi:hypothetical protein
MAESATSLFRRGMISSKQAGKLKALRGTTTNPPSYDGTDARASGGGSGFDSRKGKNDQGGRRDKGDGTVAGVGHINNRKASDFGTPARAGGRPSKGGSAPSRGGVPDYEQIDEATEQKPNFPKGAKQLSRDAQPAWVRVKDKNLAGSTRGDHGAGDRGPDNKVPKRARGGATYPSGGQYGGPNGRP